MSNLVNDRALSSSLDCPVVDGRRQIQRIPPRTADVGGIPVSRALPSRHRRVVGPWCFLDHAGPSVFQGDARGLAVGPHPHIGLQTFTWMLRGQVLHRDSLGHEQVIRPGQVNLMTAGRGISHTEESLPGESELHAAQLWIALPAAHHATEPRFDHYPELPRWHQQGVDLTLLAGTFGGHRAPTLMFSPLVGLDLNAPRDTGLRLPLREDFEYALLPLEGSLVVDDQTFEPDQLAYLGRGRDRARAHWPDGGRALLIGGQPLDGEILIWWNFVGHDRAEIARAQQDWEAGSERFGPLPPFDGPPLMPPPLPWKTGIHQAYDEG